MRNRDGKGKKERGKDGRKGLSEATEAGWEQEPAGTGMDVRSGQNPVGKE